MNMLQVKIIFRLFFFETTVVCFNVGQFGEGKKTLVTRHKLKFIACKCRKNHKHSFKLTLGLNKGF